MSHEKTTRVLTADDLAGLLEAAVSKIAAKPQSPNPTRPAISDLKKIQDDAILRRELALERREKVQRAVKRQAPLEEQIAALGSEVTPLQLVKLQQRQTGAPSQQQLALPPSSDGQDLVRQVLGVNASTREMERFADIQMKLQGKGVTSNERGEIEINGYPIQGSNLATALRFIVKGSRGFKGQVPLGVAEMGDLLRQAGIASSKFPESVRPWLGGRRGRLTRGAARLAQSAAAAESQSSVDSSDDEVGTLAKSMEGLTVDSDEPQQHGSGIDILNEAMDHAELGDHDSAYDALHAARQLKVPREKLKSVERYLASLRD